jgi:predicted dehydrogenase/uncharacterized membrane protein YbhN (UPF0104 family)
LKLRGAMLGAGNIALRGHAPQWAGAAPLPRDVEIVAIADLCPSNLDAARAFFPAAALYSSADDLLAREDVDFCDICTPPFTHAGLIEGAAARGLHVLCEKPLAPTLDAGRRISEAVRAAGIVFQPCHQYHHSPDWQLVRSLLPRLGRIYFAEYEVHRTEANEGNPNWTPGWRTDEGLAGGGILVDHGAHIFYQLRAILGEPQSVQATVRTLQHRSYRVEDTALVVLDFGACLAQVSLTWAARRREIQFRFVGERGELVGDDRGVRVHADTLVQLRFDEGMSRGSSHSDWYGPLFDDFAKRVRAGDRSHDALEEAFYVTKLIARAYQSSREGRRLAFAEEPPSLAAETPGPEAVVAGLGGEVQGAPVAPDSRRRSRLLRAAAAAAVVAAAAWTFRDVAWAPLWGQLMAAHPGWIAAAAAVNLAVVALQALRWLALTRPLSRAATFGRAFEALVVGFAFSTILPARAGEFARVRSFSRHTGLSGASILATIVLDYLVNAAGLLLGLAILPFVIEVPIWIRPGAVAALALFTVGGMLVFALRPAGRDSAPPLPHLPVKGPAVFLSLVRQGLGATHRPGALGMSLGASLVAWALEINVTALAMRAVGLHLPLSAAFLVLLAVNLALAVPFAPPGNLGTLEVGATLALVGFGVAKEQALAFGIVYHLLQVVPVGLCGIAFTARSLDGPIAA